MLPSPAWRRCLVIHRPLAESRVSGPSRPTPGGRPPGAAAAICGRAGGLWTVTSATEQHRAGSLQRSITRLLQFFSGRRLEVVGPPPRRPELCRSTRPVTACCRARRTPCPSPRPRHVQEFTLGRRRVVRRGQRLGPSAGVRLDSPPFGGRCCIRRAWRVTPMPGRVLRTRRTGGAAASGGCRAGVVSFPPGVQGDFPRLMRLGDLLITACSGSLPPVFLRSVRGMPDALVSGGLTAKPAI
jgi:hypothetical protein